LTLEKKEKEISLEKGYTKENYDIKKE